MTCPLSVVRVARGSSKTHLKVVLPSGRLARVDLHAFAVADQEHLVTGRHRKVGRDGRRGRRGVGHLRHGQGRRGHGEAYAHGAAETGKSGHSRINSEKQVGTGSVHATDTGQLRGWEVLAMVALMCADCARWAASRGERGLVGTNAGYGLIPVWPDCATSARVPTTSGPTSVAHADPQIDAGCSAAHGQHRVMSEDTECVHGMEYGCSICSGKDVRRPESEGIEFSYRAKYEGQCPECDLPIVVGPAVRQDDEGSQPSRGLLAMSAVSIRPTAPPSMAVRVFRDGAVDELTIWPASGRKGKDYRTDILMLHPDDGVVDLRKGLTNGSILDLPPGLRTRVVAHIKVRVGATAIRSEDIRLISHEAG